MGSRFVILPAVLTLLVAGIVPSLASAQSSGAAASGDQNRPGSRTQTIDPDSSSPGNPSGSLTLEGAGGAIPSAGILAGRPTIAVSRTDRPPSIDGHLDDAAWRTAARVDQFVQQRPRQGAAATEQTEVFVAYDSRNIYFGIYAHYSDPGSMRVNHADRDRIGQDDKVSIFFDPFLDQQRAYVFSVNGYGVQGDSLMGGGGGRGGPGGGGGGDRGGGGGGGGGRGMEGDTSWNALFSSVGTLVADGWTAELAIPFKSLRYPSRQAGAAHRWGFQIQRDIESKGESVVWSPVLRNVASFLGQMGTLDGLANLSTSRNLEILPTFTAVRSDALDTTSGAVSVDKQPEVGLNVKYGVTSNLTADFTVNPDFSQIESDRQQIQVNQRFPLFYAELRPFFLEGQEIFNVPGPVTFIHTRTIVDPQAGTKLTGKVGKTTLGVMLANDAAPGNVDDPNNAAFGKTAQFLFGRVRYDLYSESHLGVVFTDREFLDRYSRAGGFDGRFRIGTTHRLDVLTVFSDQRDETGARRTGNIYNLSFQKEGRGLTYSVSSSGVDPDFRTDAGFVRRTNVRQSFAGVSYRWYPEHLILSWGPRVNYGRNYNYARVLQDEDFSVGGNIMFARNINIGGNYARAMERYLGVKFRKTRYAVMTNVNTSRRFGFGVFFNTGDEIRYVENPFLGEGTNLNFNLSLRPFSRLDSQLSLNTTNFVQPRTGEELYNARILRSVTTYQFTNRLSLRNITERNTYDKTFAANVLAMYRVNAGTVFFVGYDDRYRRGDAVNSELFPTTELRRTNRAIFTKLQFLFRM